MVVKDGDKVKVEYVGTLDDGEVFDQSKHDDHEHPIEFEVGAKQVVPGFEEAVKGMKKGEEKEFHLKASEAYGQPRKELIKKIPKEKLPGDVKKGMMIGLQTPKGQIPARVTKVGKETVTINLNHPLAGKDLNFKVKVVSIESPEK